MLYGHLILNKTETNQRNQMDGDEWTTGETIQEIIGITQPYYSR